MKFRNTVHHTFNRLELMSDSIVKLKSTLLQCIVLQNIVSPQTSMSIFLTNWDKNGSLEATLIRNTSFGDHV